MTLLPVCGIANNSVSGFELQIEDWQQRRWPHRLAVTVTCATFPLIWVGGLVTTTDAGMAVPDWPSTFGYNLLLYPWQTWISGPWDVFIEHGHRLLGIVVGVLTLALSAVTLRSAVPRWLKTSVILALVGVIAQGGLGGLRVLLDQRTLAFLHGCLGPAFFAYCAGLCVVMARPGSTGQAAPAAEAVRKLWRVALSTAVVSYLQLIVGGYLRHVHYGTAPRMFQIAVLFHLLGAVALIGYSLVLLRVAKGITAVRWPTRGLCLLILVQIGLGVGTWFLKYAVPLVSEDWSWLAGYTLQAGSLSQAVTVTSHVAIGSLILATTVLIAVRAGCLLRSAASEVPQLASCGEVPV